MVAFRLTASAPLHCLKPVAAAPKTNALPAPYRDLARVQSKSTERNCVSGPNPVTAQNQSPEEPA
jgi:hypothetical protein